MSYFSMSMETVSSAALAMGRTLVLPPAQELHMLSSSDDEQKDEFSFNDFFPMESISREHEGFSIITMEQYLNLFLEGKLKHPHTGESIFPPNNRTNWNGCSMNDFEILKSWLRKSSKRLKVSDTACLLAFPRSSNSTATEEMDQLQYGIKQKSKIGWSSFIGKPTPVDAAPKDRLRENLASRSSLCVYDRELQEAPWVHFPVIKDPADASRMLVHFYAFLFFADWKMDLWTKRFVRDHLRYVDELQCTAARIVNAIRKRVLKRTAGKIEEFDTMHVRRGDFQSQYSFSNSTAEDIYKMTRQRIPDNTTVYIATDERNKTFFDPMKQHYEILFLDDFKMELKGINSNFYGMIDQLVASRGRVFFGCWPSTFTGYINRLRGDNDIKLRSGVQRNASTSVAAEDGSYVPKQVRRSGWSCVIAWLDNVRCPPKCCREGDGVLLITGVDRVVYGTQAAADVVTILGVRPPRYPFYMVSGFLCDLIQFVIDVFLHVFLHLEDPSVCWALGFGLSISFRHTFHRYLVFGDYVGGYWMSLGRMYAGYSIIIVISTVFNIVMTHYAKLPHYIAWVVTLLWTGIVNYFILKKLWTFGNKDEVNASKVEVRADNPEIGPVEGSTQE
eukprot:scaffold880_cov132-Cylindrotheca_fusiformis.AAC.65